MFLNAYVKKICPDTNDIVPVKNHFFSLFVGQGSIFMLRERLQSIPGTRKPLSGVFLVKSEKKIFDRTFAVANCTPFKGSVHDVYGECLLGRHISQSLVGLMGTKTRLVIFFKNLFVDKKGYLYSLECF